MRKQPVAIELEDNYTDEFTLFPDYEPHQIETPAESVPNKRNQKKVSTDSILAIDPFYSNTTVVETGEASRKRFAKLAQIAKNGNEEEKKAAYEEAIKCLKGMIRDMAVKKFKTYLERDPDYLWDLEQEAYIAIVEHLKDYNPERALPSTFFHLYFKSVMVAHTNKSKNYISQADLALSRKMKQIKKEYEEMGRIPTAADYAFELGITLSRVRAVLLVMDMDLGGGMEDIDDYHWLLPGDEQSNSAFLSPEAAAIRGETIDILLAAMRKNGFSDDDILIFYRNKVDGESPEELAKTFGRDANETNKLIEKIRHTMYYDSDVRKAFAPGGRGPALSQITILPLEGENENMDLLETIEF